MLNATSEARSALTLPRRIALLACAIAATGCAPAVAAPSTGGFTNARIANVAHTANAGEVQVGGVAVERAADARVRQFAQRMVDEHTAADQQIAAVQDPTAETDPMATDLQRNARQTMTALQTYKGAAFDRAYMDNQVAMHTWVLRNLDGTLIPATSSAPLRTVLEQMRTSVADHLRAAQELRTALQ